MDVGVRHSQVYIWTLSPVTFVILDHVTNISELHFLNAVLGWLNTPMYRNTEHRGYQIVSIRTVPILVCHTWPRVEKYHLLALAVLGSLWSLLVPYSPNFIHARKHAFPQFNNTDMEYILWPPGDNGMVVVIWLHIYELNPGCSYSIMYVVCTTWVAFNYHLKMCS